MNRRWLSLVVVGASLVCGTACDMAAEASAALASGRSKTTYYDNDERNAYAYGTPSPDRRGVVMQTTREQRMRYCRQMFGMDGHNPLAPDYRPARGDLCYSVWKELYLDPALARYAAYYSKR